jgi:hypothetical protein
MARTNMTPAAARTTGLVSGDGNRVFTLRLVQYANNVTATLATHQPSLSMAAPDGYGCV